jgi:N-methylhydantoinase B
MFKMFCGTFMISVFDPQILFNDGFYDHGCAHSRRLPAETAAAGRAVVPHPRAGAHLRRDLRSARPGQPRFPLRGGILRQSRTSCIRDTTSNGEWYQLFQIGFGGIPGRPMGDGPDGHSLWPGFTNVPNEYIEAYFPLRIEAYETIRTRADRAATAAATGSAWPTGSSRTARSPSTTIAGSPSPGA